jgi:drug/metabolite transporter (DMT)-like permease
LQNLPSALIDRVQRHFRLLPPDLSASLLMLMAMFVFTATGVLVRMAAESMPIFQILFLRQILTVALMSPLFWRHRNQILHPQGMRLHIFRGFAAVGAMSCGNAAVIYIPFADVTAIQMSEVLFITALAAMFLGEKVGWRRWTATLVGFTGVGVMLQPFSGPIETFALIALVGSMFGAMSVITLRFGSRLDTTETVIFFQSCVVIVCMAPLAWWFWVPTTARGLGILMAMAVMLALGTLLFTNAFRRGNASAIAPLQYLRLLMMAGVGYWIYGETPGLATIVGSALIVGAAIYTLHRNAIRQSPIPAAPRPDSPA